MSVEIDRYDDIHPAEADGYLAIDHGLDDDDQDFEQDDGECPRFWIKGEGWYCPLVGTEECDWECPE